MNEVTQWFDSGAEVREGLRLLSIYAPNRHLEALVNAQPQKYIGLLKTKLRKFADAAPKGETTKRSRFREVWPFLSDPSCPAELKILAADKITAYHNYVEGHEGLYMCTDLDSCFECAKKVIENFTENRQIAAEFTYYKEHGSCLGRHPIFSETKRLAELRAMTVSELFRKRKNLEGAIWRINSEISKGDKPHLLTERESRLRSKRRELDEVNKMINDYENRK